MRTLLTEFDFDLHCIRQKVIARTFAMRAVEADDPVDAKQFATQAARLFQSIPDKKSSHRIRCRHCGGGGARNDVREVPWTYPRMLVSYGWHCTSCKSEWEPEEGYEFYESEVRS